MREREEKDTRKKEREKEREKILSGGDQLDSNLDFWSPVVRETLPLSLLSFSSFSLFLFHSIFYSLSLSLGERTFLR